MQLYLPLEHLQLCIRFKPFCNPAKKKKVFNTSTNIYNTTLHYRASTAHSLSLENVIKLQSDLNGHERSNEVSNKYSQKWICYGAIGKTAHWNVRSPTLTRAQTRKALQEDAQKI